MRLPNTKVVAILLVVYFSVSGVWAQDTKAEPCPEVSIWRSQNFRLEIGEIGKFSVFVDQKGFDRSLTYEWSVSGGEIVSGQETTYVEIKKTQPELAVTILVNGLRPECQSRVTKVENIKQTEGEDTRDEVVRILQVDGPISEVKHDQIIAVVTQMRGHPGQTLWIYFRSNQYGIGTIREERMKQLYEAFRKENFGHDDRITFIDVESSRDSIEFWRTSPNATPPKP